MHRWLKRWGVMKPGNLTAGEFVGYFSDLDAMMGETVSELSLLYTRAQYSPTAPNNDDARRAIALLHQLWDQWRQSRGRFTTPETAE